MADAFQMECQAELYWCWAAVGVSLNRYFSPDETLKQCELATHILTGLHNGHIVQCCNQPLPPEADTPAKLQDVLSTLGLLKGQPLTRPLTFDEIRTQINAGFPVCVRIQWQGQKSGHFVVIRGFAVLASGEQYVDIADPCYRNSTMLYEDFANYYQSYGEWSDTFPIQPPNGGN